MLRKCSLTLDPLPCPFDYLFNPPPPYDEVVSLPPELADFVEKLSLDELWPYWGTMATV